MHCNCCPRVFVRAGTPCKYPGGSSRSSLRGPRLGRARLRNVSRKEVIYHTSQLRTNPCSSFRRIFRRVLVIALSEFARRGSESYICECVSQCLVLSQRQVISSAFRYS